MATSPTGYAAYYQTPAQREAKQIGETKPVIRWDADGTAMVVDEQRGELVPARSLPHFRYLVEEESPVVGALPPQGWQLGYGQDDGTEVVDDLIGWAVHATGVITPIVAGEWNQGQPIFHDTVENELRLIPPQPSTGRASADASHTPAEKTRKEKQAKPWCGECDHEETRWITIDIDGRALAAACPRCHPDPEGVHRRARERSDRIANR